MPAPITDHAKRTEEGFGAVGLDTHDAREVTTFSRYQEACEMLTDVYGR